MEIIDIEELKRLNRDSGQYWFSADTTRFFRSRYPRCAYKFGDVAFFVTSEQQEGYARHWTIRVFHYSDNVVEDLCGFNILTKGQARYRFNKLLKDAENGVDVLKLAKEEQEEFVNA